jgi:hypothetical protein
MAIVAQRGTERFLSDQIGVIDPHGQEHWPDSVRGAPKVGCWTPPGDGPELEAARRHEEAELRRIGEILRKSAEIESDREETVRAIRRGRGRDGRLHVELGPLPHDGTDD